LAVKVAANRRVSVCHDLFAGRRDVVAVVETSWTSLF
jgi:hypothetical protein